MNLAGPCRKSCNNDSCGRCRKSWGTLGDRNSCERMPETRRLCLPGVLRTSVQSGTEPHAATRLARGLQLGKIAFRFPKAWVNCKAHAQASRHCLVSQPQDRRGGVPDQRDQHFLRKNTMLVHACFITLHSPYLRTSTRFSALPSVVPFVALDGRVLRTRTLPNSQPMT